MASAVIKRFSSGVMPVILIVALLLGSLYLMSAATQNSEQFGRLYSLLFVINLLGR